MASFKLYVIYNNYIREDVPELALYFNNIKICYEKFYCFSSMPAMSGGMYSGTSGTGTETG